MAHRLAASLSAVVPGQMGRPGADRATTVFFNGLGRYKVFRIPALCRTANALLAFAEARPTVDDHGKIDLVLRRSTDGGRTWSDLVVVARGDETSESIGNPVPISLGGGGKFGFGEIVLLYCSNAAHLTEDAIRGGATAGGGRRVWLRRSFDAGLKWTQPVELTSLSSAREHGTQRAQEAPSSCAMAPLLCRRRLLTASVSSQADAITRMCFSRTILVPPGP